MLSKKGDVTDHVLFLFYMNHIEAPQPFTFLFSVVASNFVCLISLIEL